MSERKDSEKGAVRNSMPRTKPKPAFCQNCGLRPPTNRYSETGGALAFNHGFFAWWCEECILERQIAYAKERAMALPGLEKRLKDLQDV